MPNGRRRPHTRYYLDLLERLETVELEYKLRRVRADAFQQRFWTDNNLRFRGALSEYEQQQQQPKALAADPSAAGAAAAKKDSQAISKGAPSSDDLAPFYTAWLSANSNRHKAYNRSLVSQLFRDLGPAWRYESLKAWAKVVRRAEKLLGRA